jgi:hypothetical protein
MALPGWKVNTSKECLHPSAPLSRDFTPLFPMGPFQTIGTALIMAASRGGNAVVSF